MIITFTSVSHFSAIRDGFTNILLHKSIHHEMSDENIHHIPVSSSCLQSVEQIHYFKRRNWMKKKILKCNYLFKHQINIVLYINITSNQTEYIK